MREGASDAERDEGYGDCGIACWSVVARCGSPWEWCDVIWPEGSMTVYTALSVSGPVSTSPAVLYGVDRADEEWSFVAETLRDVV